MVELCTSGDATEVIAYITATIAAQYAARIPFIVGVRSRLTIGQVQFSRLWGLPVECIVGGESGVSGL